MVFSLSDLVLLSRPTDFARFAKNGVFLSVSVKLTLYFTGAGMSFFSNCYDAVIEIFSRLCLQITGVLFSKNLSIALSGLYVAGPGVFFAFLATSANTLILAVCGKAGFLPSLAQSRITEYFYGLGICFE